MGRLAGLVAEQDVDTVVVGLPLSLSGDEGAQAREARQFAERLGAVLSVPVETYDERFTTKLAEAGPGRASEDSRAAAHLLESYLRARESASRSD